MADLNTMNLVERYLQHRISLSQFYSQLLSVPYSDARDDAFLADVRSLISEATSAEWHEEQLRAAIRDLVPTDTYYDPGTPVKYPNEYTMSVGPEFDSDRIRVRLASGVDVPNREVAVSG